LLQRLREIGDWVFDVLEGASPRANAKRVAAIPAAMGLFDRIIRQIPVPQPLWPPGPPPPPPGPPPSTGPFTPTSFPFAGEVRMVHMDYPRIATGWWKVTVNSPQEWTAMTAQMSQTVRTHFGAYVTRTGAPVPRWNDATWDRVRQRLIVQRR
jgi:hypothetical protein